MTYLEGQIKQCEVYIQYWLTLAANPAADNRTIFVGEARRPMSTSELQADAMRTAMNHIRRLNDLIEALPTE